MRQKSTKETSANPNDMCWPSEHPRTTTYELNCLGPAATYDFLLDSDGDYFQGAWRWHNCIDNGTCTDFENLGERIRLDPTDRLHKPAITEGFGYFFSAATLKAQTPFRRDQDVHVIHTLPAAYLEAFKPHGTMHAWCSNEGSTPASFTMQLFTLSDTNAETKVAEAAADCTDQEIRRLFYEPFVVDGTFARLRVRELLRTTATSDYDSNAAVTGQRLMIDVPLGIGCFSGLPPPADAQDVDTNDVPTCLVRCHGLGKPVAALRGASCACLDQMPYASLRPSRSCHTPCHGERWMCGGQDEHSFYTASCPDGWQRVGHFCYKKFADAAADTARKAHALCSMNNAELFNPRWSYDYNMASKLLVSDGASAFLGFKIIRNPAAVYTFSGELMTDFEEIKSLTKLGADADCVEVARSGTTLTASGACTASAEVICQQPLVRGWGTQEIAETDDLVMRTASSGSDVFAHPSQWWSPAADDTSPRLVWEFSRQVMVSGFKISSKSDKLMESFFLKYKEDYLSNDTERFYATSEAGDIYEFNITSGLQLSGEFTAHIHLAYPKVSNWFALLPSRYVAGAEVKVTLLGSTASESVTVSERPGVAGSAALNLTEICRDADHSDLEGEGFQLMNAEPELWPGHSSLIHAYKKVPEMAYQICQPRTQCRRTGDGNVLCTPYRAMWYTRKASRTCAAGFHNVVGHCVTPSAQALSQEAGAEACSSVPGVPIEFNSAAEFTLFRLMMVTHQMNESIYIGVRRSGDSFVNGAGEPLPPATQFHRIWAPNEPASTGDCVILDPEVDFFARAVDCSTPYPTYCQPRAPRNCPADFEYQGDSYSCFHFHVDTSRVWDHTAASEYCRHKGTSLAVPRDQQQLDLIKDLVDRVITKAVDAGGSDTEHTGALGAVLLNDDGDDPNITVTINNISPQPTKTSWNLLKESMSSSKSCAYTVQGSDIEPNECIGSGSHINYPVCQYHACYALNSSAECVFPFRYKGRVYGHCTRLDSDDGSAWCPTQLVNGEASRTNGSFATCLDSCPVRQCPVGFLEIAAPHRSAPLCLLLSSNRDEEVLIPPRTPGQQRDFCERLGSRPLTLESPFHYELIKNNVSKVFPEFKQYVAFGGYYWNAADPHLILDSGRRPSPRVLELVKSSFDDALLGTYNTTCVVMKGDTFQNVPCDVGMAYHACEANVEYTESGPAAGQLCHFPFTYAGRNYSSCAENTDRGQAWCATAVTGDGLVDGDNWGYCPPGDERTVAGPASPERCQFPFIAGGVRYERCTKVTGVTTPDTGGRFWCSTANDAAGVMTRPDAWGECHENIWPPDNPYCNAPFEGNGEGKCAYLHHEKITDDTEAAGVCSNINAELAIPFSKEHQEVLDEFIQEKDKTYFPNFDYIRTSGYKSNGQWFWKGALDIGFFNWAAAGEAAKEGCVFIDTTVGPPYRWVVLACDTPAYTVCRAACADGQITFNGRCLEVSTTTVIVSVLAEAACHDKGQRLFTPSSDAELRQLQGVMAAQYPGKLPAIIGLTECRFSFADLWRRSRADRQVPRTVDGKLARWAIPGTNYQYDQPFPCLDETSQGLYFTLEPPSAPQPMTAYANTKSLSLNYICAPDLTDPCPEGYHPLDDQCIKVSDTTATYHEAQAACHEDNADLLYIKYFHERYTVPLLVKALNSAQLTRQFVWIGYDRIDDPTFTNIWGEPGSFKQGWLKNGPGTTPQDCVILQKDTSWLGGYVFNVRDCNERHHYACTYRGQQRKNICPEEFPFYYQGDCFRVSNSSLTFAQAEVECSLSTSGYSKLAAPQASHVSMFGYLAARFDDLWVGLDDRAGGLTNSGGDPVLPATVARLPTPDASSRRRRSTGQCMAIRDGGYQLTDCQERRRHVCLLVRSPSCPDRFIRHQDNCYLVPNQRPRGEDYATAERKCALTGSFVAADRDARQADFLKALWTAVNHTSYWVGLSSDEKDETSLFYPNWEPFTSGNYSRFDAPPSMAAPACTVVASDDGFATWRESSCVQRANIICHYQGLPTCPAGYTALLDSGYTCLRHSPDNGTYWSKFSECYNDGPNTGLAVVSSGRVQAAMMSFVEKESNAASTAPFWISFRGPSALVDEPEHQNRPVGNVVQRVRWIDYNAMTWTDEVTELHNNGTNMTEIWRDKCATLDLESNWLRNDCLDNFAALCEHTACYSTRGHQCIFPFLGPEDGVEYHNCTSLDTTNIFQPYCATEVNSTGHAVRIEKCQRYCYFRRPVVKCYDPPLHPLLGNETDPTVWRANWTSSWDGVTHLKQYQNITYQCPIGYVFDKNNKNIIKLTCGNWTWEPEPGLSNATCQPVQCSRELPNVPADTSPGNASVLVWDGLYEYLTPIEFTCPTGHVFEGLVRKAHEGNWSINPSPWSQLTSVECDATGQWMPAFLPNCVPFDCLGPPLEPPEWVSYDWDNATISYGHTVRYWCTPGVGWAFPSDGAIEHFSTCQENGNWSLTELEDCILMPCPDPAPETVTNQTFSYGLVFSNYTCPPAWEFADGSRQKSAECLLETKVWEPAVMPPCQKRRCAEEPPEVFQKGMTRKWPKGEDGQPNYELDVVIQYRCPHRRLTWEFNETIQEVMCIHDPESDLMVWEPFNITLCNPTSCGNRDSIT
ncbi:uncharacterized protein LOC122390202 [Amphibalanus amphitrite]|uniref:uncharacterized protein LOC122390202 n=1 Tax=Amphibalanus amphitrite TaxID=1232801 RepID=UPI001C9083BF|nr:uncharacterized protein LOC122390202 [Amphibalanus amphitrite]